MRVHHEANESWRRGGGIASKPHPPTPPEQKSQRSKTNTFATTSHGRKQMGQSGARQCALYSSKSMPCDAHRGRKCTANKKKSSIEDRCFANEAFTEVQWGDRESAKNEIKLVDGTRGLIPARPRSNSAGRLRGFGSRSGRQILDLSKSFAVQMRPNALSCPCPL